MELDIRHRVDRQRFETVVQGQSCVLDYRLDDGVMSITHTEVAPALQGRGIAAALVRAALDHAAVHRLKVRPACSYARTYLRRHPDPRLTLA